MSMHTTNWINALLFQLVWFTTVTGAAHGAWWIGPLATTGFAGWQLRSGNHARADLALIALVLPIGFIADSLLAHAQWVLYASAVPSENYAPIWILALWASLALTLNHSLAFLKRNLWLAAALGAIGAPLSFYFAAHTWHAVAFGQSAARSLAAIAAIWVVVTPLLVWAARALGATSTVRITELRP